MRQEHRRDRVVVGDDVTLPDPFLRPPDLVQTRDRDRLRRPRRPRQGGPSTLPSCAASVTLVMTKRPNSLSRNVALPRNRSPSGSTQSTKPAKGGRYRNTRPSTRNGTPTKPPTRVSPRVPAMRFRTPISGGKKPPTRTTFQMPSNSAMRWIADPAHIRRETREVDNAGGGLPSSPRAVGGSRPRSPRAGRPIAPPAV
jgi:hypothetical protein